MLYSYKSTKTHAESTPHQRAPPSTPASKHPPEFVSIRQHTLPHQRAPPSTPGSKHEGTRSSKGADTGGVVKWTPTNKHEATSNRKEADKGAVVKWTLSTTLAPGGGKGVTSSIDKAAWTQGARTFLLYFSTFYFFLLMP